MLILAKLSIKVCGEDNKLYDHIIIIPPLELGLTTKSTDTQNADITLGQNVKDDAKNSITKGIIVAEKGVELQPIPAVIVFNEINIADTTIYNVSGKVTIDGIPARRLVSIYDIDNVLIASTYSNATTGEYIFVSAPSTSYFVAVHDPVLGTVSHPISIQTNIAFNGQNLFDPDDYVGSGTIYGVVTDENTNPISRRVILLDDATYVKVKETTSSAVDGSYKFDFITTTKDFNIVCEDDADPPTYNHILRSRVRAIFIPEFEILNGYGGAISESNLTDNPSSGLGQFESISDEYNEFALTITPDTTPRRMIQTGVASPMTTSGTFTLVSALGGDSVAFTGHECYNSDTRWGPHLAFDNTTGYDDWCSLGTSGLFGQWVFPFPVVITSIFLMMRLWQDHFPSSLVVRRDGTSLGTFNTTTLTQGVSGHGTAYSGTGYKIQLDSTPGTTWRLEFPSGDYVYIGEIEFWGYRGA